MDFFFFLKQVGVRQSSFLLSCSWSYNTKENLSFLVFFGSWHKQAAPSLPWSFWKHGEVETPPYLFFFGYQNMQGWDKAPYHHHVIGQQVMGGTLVPPPFFSLQLGISKWKNKIPHHYCGHCASIGGDSPPPPPLLFHFFNILIFRTNGTQEQSSLPSPCSSPCTNGGASIPFFFFFKGISR